MFISFDIYPHDVVLRFKSKGDTNKICVHNIDSDNTNLIKVGLIDIMYQLIKMNEFRKESKHDMEGQS